MYLGFKILKNLCKKKSKGQKFKAPSLSSPNGLDAEEKGTQEGQSRDYSVTKLSSTKGLLTSYLRPSTRIFQMVPQPVISGTLRFKHLTTEDDDRTEATSNRTNTFGKVSGT